MKKAVIIWGAIILVLVLIVGGIFYSLFSDSVTSASLVVKESPVFVDSGKGFVEVTGTVALSKHAIVKTGDGARASIILFESSITMLDPNTQVSIASLIANSPQLKQDSGSTFTKFTGLTGMDTLEIQTPNAVATVRGTAYRVQMDGILVLEGRVGVAPRANGSSLDEQAVTGGNGLFSNETGWSARALTQDEMTAMHNEMKLMIVEMQTVRDSLVFENEKLLGIAQSRFNITPDMIKDELARADAGAVDVDEMVAQIPINLPVITRIAAMTKLIANEMKTYNAQTN